MGFVASDKILNLKYESHFLNNHLQKHYVG